MDMDTGKLQRADRVIWIVIAVVAGAVLISPAFGNFQIQWASFQKAALVSALLISVSWFYRGIRKDANLAQALMSAAQIIAFAAVGAPLSYVAASAAFPLWDVDLAALDHRLGLDWMAWLAAMNAAPILHAILAFAYGSFAVQTTAIVIVLAIAGHALRVRIFILSFMLATLVTIAISIVMPAQGVWGYLHLSALDAPGIVPMTRDLPLPVFFGLRDGTFRDLVAEGAQGIISFPSLHAALGLLFIFALWPIRYIGWISVVLNLSLIAATPVDGSHHFSDVGAGLIVAALSWIAVKHAFAQVGLPRTNWLMKTTRARPNLPNPVGLLDT